MAARQLFSRQVTAPLRSQVAPRMTAALVQRAPRRSASGGPHYNEPSGYLFGEQPGKPKEDWENIFMYGMFGGMALATVLIIYKPDTTVQTWALAEARRSSSRKAGCPSGRSRRYWCPECANCSNVQHF